MQKCENWCASYYPVLGRVFLALLFIYAGYEKLMDVLNAGGVNMVGLMQYVKIPMAGMALLILIIAVEIIAGLMLIVGYKTKWAACTLTIFTILTIYFFHFQAAQILEALKNVAIIGGLLYVSAFGSGSWSIDAWQSKKSSTPSMN